MRTVRFQIQLRVLVLAHERRRIVHFAVTASDIRSGVFNNRAKPFPGMPHRDIC